MKKIWPHFKLQGIHLYTGVSLMVAVLAISLVTLLGAWRQNQQSIETQQVVARFETNDAFEFLKGKIRLMVYRQDAYDNIARRWNQPWISYQFGPYLDTIGNRLVAIVGPGRDLRFVHAASNEQTFTPDKFLHADGLDALLRATHRAGLKQPPPLQAGVIVVGGKPYFAVAAYITPEDNKDLAAGRRAPFTAIFLKPATVAQYDDFEDGFDTHDVAITTDAGGLAGQATLPLDDAEGHPVAYVHWTPHLPGDSFLESVTIPLAAVLLLLAVIQLVVIRRWLRLQRQLIGAENESNAAREQSRLKSVFLGTISHELRTPLNAIIGYSDVLCCQMFGPLGSPRNAEYVRDIRDSGCKLLDTVNDLIEIARIDAGDTDNSEDSFDPASAARQAVSAARKHAKPKNVHVVLRAPKKTGCCKGSLINLSQAMERILDNAVRHSDAGSTITVELSTTDHAALIEIRDRGEGIPPDRLAELTRLFSHSDNHLVASDAKGMGFGIPIARGLVELMGGTFEIDSTPQVGTTVRISLPLNVPEQEPIPDEEPAESFAPTGVIWTGRGRDFVARRIGNDH